MNHDLRFYLRRYRHGTIILYERSNAVETLEFRQDLSGMQEENLGTIKISDDVITACAAGAVTRIQGVSRLAAGFTENLSINILGIEPGGKGIKLSKDEEGLILDIYVIVEYKVKIPQLAWEIQSSVKKEIESITDVKVKAVNIHVQGVNLPGEEDEK